MRIIVRILLVLAALVCALAPASAAPSVDEATTRKIDELLSVRAESGDLGRGELIERLSARLLGTPYGANMLIGSATEPEQLVVDLRRVDCFTYLDYIDAASRSTDRDQFLTNLIATRYIDGRVEFAQRKHFFTDWATRERLAATDITASLSPAAVTTTKHLNAKADGSTYLPGVPVSTAPSPTSPRALSTGQCRARCARATTSVPTPPRPASMSPMSASSFKPPPVPSSATPPPSPRTTRSSTHR